ncbi:MAG TPA: acetyl-CoA hydrolase, partial [Pseudomonas sp.]|nr:acetyl-CoA hydrolase [Pseudomonas sp.]
MTEIVNDVEQCVDRAIARVGKQLVIGAPLGLGKPVQLINAFYRRAVADPGLSLHIYTALCLEVPTPAKGIEGNLSGPIIQRLFGDYEELAFMAPLRKGTLPANIQISELYFKAGSMKNVASAQQNYISSNYTHIARDMFNAGANVMVQLVAARHTPDGLSVSLSCNPDVALEMMDKLHASDRRHITIGQVHDDLPFMQNDAEVGVGAFDLLVSNPQYNKSLFAVPNATVPLQDYATALHASTLVADGGTLQIGIGALGDAVAHSLILRQRHNRQYREAVQALSREKTAVAEDGGPFEQGLYVSTEMFVNGMLHLIENAVVKRKVYDHLALQRGINAGLISNRVDAQLYDFCRSQGVMPARLDQTSLQ